MATIEELFSRFVYENDEIFRELSTKQERMEHILQKIDLQEVMQIWFKTFVEQRKFKKNVQNIKSTNKQIYDHFYEPNQQLFEAFASEAFEGISECLRESKVNSVDEIECHIHLAKMSTRMRQFENAIKSLSHVRRIALKRLFNPELYYEKSIVFLQLVCFYSTSKLREFHRFWNECKNVKVDLTDDGEIREFAKLLQVPHLTFQHFEEHANYNLFKDDKDTRIEDKSDDSNDEESEDLTEIFDKQQVNHFTDDGLQLVIDPNRGRYMIADESIPKGKIILIEKALLLGFEKNTSNFYCLNCHKNISNKFVPCYSCPSAVYCDENCRVEAYDTFHWRECGATEFFKDPNDFHLQLMRQLYLYHRFGKGQYEDYSFAALIQEYTSNKNIQELPLCDHTTDDIQLSYALQQSLHDNNSIWEDYYDAYYFQNMFHIAVWHLLGNYVEKYLFPKEETDQRVPLWSLSESNIKHIANIIDNFPKQWNKNTPFFDVKVDDLIEILTVLQWNLRKLQTNSFGWHVEDENYKHLSVAGCTCLLASFINHSCDPNVEWEFNNGYILYRTIRPIKKGEEINNCYGPSSSQTFVNRQKHLANNYNYNCNCSLCKEQMNSYQLKQNCPSCFYGTIVFNMRTQLDASCSECFFKPDQSALTSNIEIGWSIHVSNSLLAQICPPSMIDKFANELQDENYFEESLQKLKDLLSPFSNAWQNTFECLLKNFYDKSRNLKNLQLINELHTTESKSYEWDEQTSDEGLEKLLLQHAFWMNVLEGYPAEQIHRKYGQTILVDLENRLACSFDEIEQNNYEFESINYLSMQFFK